MTTWIEFEDTTGAKTWARVSDIEVVSKKTDGRTRVVLRSGRTLYDSSRTVEELVDTILEEENR